MILYIGADHGGFELKETLKQFLIESGYTVNDVGNNHYDENDDYPDFARLVSEKVRADLYNSKGILICKSGVGVDIVANKYPEIRSVLAMSPDHAMASRSDDDTNILSLAALYIEPEQMKRIVSAWLQGSFSEEDRHKRRLEKVREIGNSIH